MVVYAGACQDDASAGVGVGVDVGVGADACKSNCGIHRPGASVWGLAMECGSAQWSMLSSYYYNYCRLH